MSKLTIEDMNEIKNIQFELDILCIKDFVHIDISDDWCHLILYTAGHVYKGLEIEDDNYCYGMIDNYGEKRLIRIDMFDEYFKVVYIDYCDEK